MKTLLLSILIYFCICLSTHPGIALGAEAEPLVIAHRGASGYLPEHTLEAKALAHAQGADYIEQDVVMSKDDQLIVFHDLTLNRVTNVEEVFPGKARSDGQYYVIDFTLEELKKLQVIQGQRQQTYSIHTLQEEIELIQGLNEILKLNTGIYPELKSPWFHHQEGKDLARATLEVLKNYGYDSKDDAIYVQSFDYNEIVRLREELLPELGIDLKLVQLIAFNNWGETFTLNADNSLETYDYNWMFTQEGINQLSTLVQGLGPSIDMIVSPDSTTGNLSITSFVTLAHDAGLEIHPYTFRDERARMPSYAESFDNLLDIFLRQITVDGVFTDYPDLVRHFIDDQGSEPKLSKPKVQ